MKVRDIKAGALVRWTAMVSPELGPNGIIVSVEPSTRTVGADKEVKIYWFGGQVIPFEFETVKEYCQPLTLANMHDPVEYE